MVVKILVRYVSSRSVSCELLVDIFQRNYIKFTILLTSDIKAYLTAVKP